MIAVDKIKNLDHKLSLRPRNATLVVGGGVVKSRRTRRESATVKIESVLKTRCQTLRFESYTRSSECVVYDYLKYSRCLMEEEEWCGQSI
jgi:hypothetical protein